MEKKKITVGQKLYSYECNEYTVSKVGKKYFECEKVRGRFSLETLRFDSDFRGRELYEDKQFVLDKKETESLESKIRIKIKNYGRTELSLEQLRNIYSIINPNTNPSPSGE